MTSEQIHEIGSGVVVFVGVVSLLFGLLRGRTFGGGLAFSLGGLGLMLYGALFFPTQKVARMAEMVAVGETVSGASEQTDAAHRILAAINPNAALEPIAVWLVVLGFGAMARAADARAATAAASRYEPAISEEGGQGEIVALEAQSATEAGFGDDDAFREDLD